MPLAILISGLAKAAGTTTEGTLLVLQLQLSQDRAEIFSKKGETMVHLQEQLDSLADVALQIRRVLDLLKDAEVGTCMYLKKKWCFYVNKSERVQENIQEILE